MVGAALQMFIASVQMERMATWMNYQVCLGEKERVGNISGSVYIFLYPIWGNIYTGKLKSLNDVSLRPLDPDLVLVSACAC